MGGTTGKLGHLGLARETVFGTAVGATIYLPFDSESIGRTPEELIDESIRARRHEGDSYEGLVSYAGDTVHKVHPAGIGHLLRSSMGAPITSDNTGSYTHVFTPLSGRNKATGTAIATTDATQITVTGTPYTASEHIGRWVHVLTGSGAGAYGIITANTTSVLTVATSPAAAVADTFEILDGPENCALPPYSMEIHRDLFGTTPAFQYIGGVVNNLSFTVGTGAKFLTSTASWLFKTGANIANTTPNLPTTDPWMWDDMVLGVGLATSNTATGGSSTTIVKTAAGWTVNAYAGYLVLTTGGTGPNQCRKIVSNTADTLTVSPAFTVAPAASTTFKVFIACNLAEALTFGWSNGLVGVPTLNNTNLISQIDSDTHRSGTISKTIIPQQITDYSTYFSGWTTREWCIFYHGAAITGAHYYDMIFYFPKVLFNACPINIGGPGRLTVAMGAKIKHDATVGVGYAVKCILQNNTSSY